MCTDLPLYLCVDRPVTYLYNTLHYYERHLRDRTNLKRKLVHAIMSSLKVGKETQYVCSFSLDWLTLAAVFIVFVFHFLYPRTTVPQVGASVKPI